MISRLLSLIFILFLVFAASRALIRGLPGDPLTTLLGETGTSLPAEVLRAELKLDQPFTSALAHDLRNALRGDFGISILSRQPIGPLVLDRFLHTLLLALTAMSIGLIFSLFIGISAATSPESTWGRVSDWICTAHGALAAAVPTPWIGPVLTYIFAVAIQAVPIGGHIALPALTLAFAFSGLWARLIRERVRETLRIGSARGARARGVPEWKVLVKYGFAPASGAIFGYMGTQFGFLLGGAFVTEVIFDWPGIGALLVDSVLRRDYPVIEAAVFVSASASLLGTSLGDGIQSLMSPKTREASK